MGYPRGRVAEIRLNRCDRRALCPDLSLLRHCLCAAVARVAAAGRAVGAIGRGCSRPIPNNSSASTATTRLERRHPHAARRRQGREAVRRMAGASRHRGHVAKPYPAGAERRRPPRTIDPGRARNAAFFDKVYGNCRDGDVEKNLDERRVAAEEDEAAAAVQQDQWRGARAGGRQRRARRVAGNVRRLPLSVGRHL